MSSPQPGPSDAQSTTLHFNSSDIGHSGAFMDSLVTFMNESSLCIQEVKQRLRMSPGCGSPVKMNEEEKQEKMNSILTCLVQKCQDESSKNESSYHTAQDFSSAYATPQSSKFFKPPFYSTPCTCPPEVSMRGASAKQMSKGRRADTPRPGTSPVRGRVATPDQYFIPVTQSSLNASPLSAGQQSGVCPTYSKMASRAPSPYSPMIDSSGTPEAFRSGPGAFDDMSSQSGRGASSYPSSSFAGSGCPPECPQSVNSTGRQEYRRLKGQDPWAFREANRTV